MQIACMSSSTMQSQHGQVQTQQTSPPGFTEACSALRTGALLGASMGLLSQTGLICGLATRSACAASDAFTWGDGCGRCPMCTAS